MQRHGEKYPGENNLRKFGNAAKRWGSAICPQGQENQLFSAFVYPTSFDWVAQDEKRTHPGNEVSPKTGRTTR